MRVVREVSQMQSLAMARRARGVASTLVPTMGALHEGHLSLIRLAHQHGDEVDVTIFVNPTQFGPEEDLDRYPRTLEHDLELCDAEGVHTVFCPDAGQMYATDSSVRICEDVLSRGLCGHYRPGHFDGVVTVVAKLFNIMLPSVAVFGRKDYQQAKVIQRLVRDLNFPVQIVLAPILREPDGLAMSSRNRYLSAPQRQQALMISKALFAAETAVLRGQRDADHVRLESRTILEEAGLTVQYAVCVDAESLEPVQRIKRPTLLAIAAFAGQTRLIDNVVLEPGSGS